LFCKSSSEISNGLSRCPPTFRRQVERSTLGRRRDVMAHIESLVGSDGAFEILHRRLELRRAGRQQDQIVLSRVEAAQAKPFAHPLVSKGPRSAAVKMDFFFMVLSLLDCASGTTQFKSP
jgi:hypothetical protein